MLNSKNFFKERDRLEEEILKIEQQELEFFDKDQEVKD